MTIEIPSSYSLFVQRLIAEGRFRNEEEVVAEGLRLIVMQEKLHDDIQAGLDDLDDGNRVDGRQVYAEARRRVKAIEDQSGP
jgi:putative addiction module CopG family antidote